MVRRRSAASSASVPIQRRGVWASTRRRAARPASMPASRRSISRAAMTCARVHAHQHDEGRRARRQRVGNRHPRRIGVARDDDERRGEAPMRDRDACERRRSDGRRDAGDDLERNAGPDERKRFFSAAPEDERIAGTSAAPHACRGSRCASDSLLDRLLAHRVPAVALADRDDLRARRERRARPVGYNAS